MELDDVHRERILFVCTANLDRSPTAVDLYRDDPRYEVRSAGVAPFAERRIDRDLLLWADRVFVMNEKEEKHRTLLTILFPGVERPTVDLDIPNRWRHGDPELAARLRRKLRPHLGPPEGHNQGRRASPNW